MLVCFGARTMKCALAVSLLATTIGCSSDDNSRVTFSAGPTPLAFAAVQNGDGPWIAIEPANDGTYSFRADAATYGIMTACLDERITWIAIMHGTTAEMTSANVDCHASVGPFGNLAVSVRGVTDPQTTSIHFADRGVVHPPGMFTLPMVPAGTWDLFAVRQQGAPPDVIHDRMIRRNEVTLTEGATTAVELDFDADGFAPESHVVMFDGGPPEQTTTVVTRLRNQPGGTYLDFGHRFDATFPALPASKLRADDVHSVSVTAYAPGGRSFRQMRRWMVAAQDFTPTFPVLPEGPIVSSEGATPYLKMRATLPTSRDADRVDVTYRQVTPDDFTVWSIALTPAYAAGIGEYTLPDLTNLAGFSTDWGLVGEHPVDWDFDTTSSDGDVRDLFDSAVPAEKLDGRTDLITHQRGRFPR
jgi:hypothetical protein